MQPGAELGLPIYVVIYIIDKLHRYTQPSSKSVSSVLTYQHSDLSM
jgi:hypothetical protein